MEKSFVVFKDGTFKTVDSNSSWEYENNSDWLVTIQMPINIKKIETKLLSTIKGNGLEISSFIDWLNSEME